MAFTFPLFYTKISANALTLFHFLFIFIICLYLFVPSLHPFDSVSLLKIIHESHLNWHEMNTLNVKGTWNLMDLPPSKKAIRCK